MAAHLDIGFSPRIGSGAQGRSRDRYGAHGLAVSLLLAFCTSCFGPAHAPEALTRTGFRSPRQTFDTFQAAIDFDLADLEYRCLSAEFTRRNGLSEATYREARDQLFDENPLLWLVSRAEVVQEGDAGSRRHWIEAKVAGRTFRLHFVREDFYEFWSGDRRVLDDFRPPSSPVKVSELGSGDFAVASEAVLDPETKARVDWAKVSEMRVGQEWKIDGVEEDSATAP